MTLLKHELRMGRKALAIWTAAIAGFIVCCVFLFPEMAGQMKTVSNIFASMGAFTAAFGMDRLNFGTLTGFYAIECGNILGIGGALFAAMLSSNLLCKEEKERTAEFLLTHPVRRSQVVAGKLLAMVVQTVVMNVAVFALAVAAVAAIGYEIPWKELALLHLSCFLVQTESIRAVCLHHFDSAVFNLQNIRNLPAGIFDGNSPIRSKGAGQDRFPIPCHHNRRSRRMIHQPKARKNQPTGQ